MPAKELFNRKVKKAHDDTFKYKLDMVVTMVKKL